jgi:hypothetical protein
MTSSWKRRAGDDEEAAVAAAIAARTEGEGRASREMEAEHRERQTRKEGRNHSSRAGEVDRSYPCHSQAKKEM